MSEVVLAIVAVLAIVVLLAAIARVAVDRFEKADHGWEDDDVPPDA